MRRRLKVGVSRSIIILIIIILIVVGGIGFYLYNNRGVQSPTQTPTVVVPSTITVDRAAPPVSVDPATSFDVVGGEIMRNVYQTLVFYNGSSTSTFVGVLASNWTVTNNGTTYIFHLWPFITFSNGDKLNATSVWFSFYRLMLVNLGISIYISQALAVNNGAGFVGTLPNGKQGLIMLPSGVVDALKYAGYSLPNDTKEAYQMASYILANILSHFNTGNSTIKKIMTYPKQAVVVLDNYTVEFNLDYPYSAFLQAISTDAGSIVDPVFVDQKGGVQIDTANTYLSTHALGSGPYVLATPLGGSYVILNANPNYWAQKVPEGQRNIMLSLPRIKTIIINNQPNEAIRVSDLQSGKAQLADVDPNYLSQLITNNGVNALKNAIAIHNLPYSYSYNNVTVNVWGPSTTIDFLAIDSYQYPFNISNVRLAIAHAINATPIQQNVYQGLAVSYVGPLDPALPYYNSSIMSYNYNPSLAIKLLVQAGFSLTLPNGTVVNPSGIPFPTITLTYQSGSTAFEQEALIVQQQLAQIGIKVQLNPETITTIVESYLNDPSSPSYPAFQLAGNTPVLVSPINPPIYLMSQARLHHGNPAFFNNSQVNYLISLSIRTTNPTLLQQIFNNMTLISLKQAQYIWLDDFVAYTVSSTIIKGLWYNPGLAGSVFYASLY